MVLSLAEEVAEAGSTIVLFWTSTLELAEEEPVAAGLRDTLDVASVLPAVLFWNGALEATEEEAVAAVLREPITAVFKDTLDVDSRATPVVLLWNSASEAIDEELIAALFETPVAAVFKATLEVVDAAVLFWNSASEAIEEEPIAALFEEPINTVLTEPVAAVFKGTLDVVDKATPSVLFWNGAPEVSGVGTTLPEGAESVVPLDEDSTWKAEHMLAVLSPETNSPVSLLR